jgi:hypothetical protein
MVPVSSKKLLIVCANIEAADSEKREIPVIDSRK